MSVKSQKRNARKRRAKARALSGNEIHLEVYYVTSMPRWVCQCEDERDCHKRGLLAAANKVSKPCGVRSSGMSILREAQWSWDTTSHERRSSIPAELKEVLTYVSTKDFADCPQSVTDITIRYQGEIKGAYRWQAGTKDLEAVVADVIAVMDF